MASGRDPTPIPDSDRELLLAAIDELKDIVMSDDIYRNIIKLHHRHAEIPAGFEIQAPISGIELAVYVQDPDEGTIYVDMRHWRVWTTVLPRLVKHMVTGPWGWDAMVTASPPGASFVLRKME